MDGQQGDPTRPAWGAKSSWASPASTSSPCTPAASKDPTPSSSSSSAFPPLSSPQARRPASRNNAHFSYPFPSSSLISQTSFNPYPTRRQELAQRAASHGTRKRSHITRSNPSASRIHSLFDYDQDDDALMHDLNDGDDNNINDEEEDDDQGEVSARGATMSSIVFRDLSSSASTSRSSSPWQQGGLSPGLAMFATTTFGGEPLRVLANVDEELGAAHMGPRIYKRHNQKHARSRLKTKIEAAHSAAAVAVPMATGKAAMRDDGRDGALGGVDSVDVSIEEKERLRTIDLQRVVDECRRYQALSAVQNRLDTNQQHANTANDDAPTKTLLAAIRARVVDARTWSSSNAHRVISDDLLPTGPQHPPIDFSILPQPTLVQVRRTVVSALNELLDGAAALPRSELISVLAILLAMRSLRPTSIVDVDLKHALQQTFLHLLETVNRLDKPSDVLSSVFAIASSTTESDLLVDLVGELVGLCGQQMASNPAVLTESQDKTLVIASNFLSLCFAHNAARPAATRLPAHAFYCTVLDLAPFLEHFVHYAASLARDACSNPGSTSAVGGSVGGGGSGMAEFNICRYPFLLSLGAKVRILQLENEIRLSQPLPPRHHDSFGTTSQCFTTTTTTAGGQDGDAAELVVLPTSFNLRIERDKAWEQSRTLFLQLLESGTSASARGLRVEFAREHAADGGGPAREWFATVGISPPPYSTNGGADRHQRYPHHMIGSRGWFSPSTEEDKEAHDTAAFLGLLLSLATLHYTKVALPFRLPAVAFKIATAPNVDDLNLTPVDLEFADGALAKSLQSVLDWSPPPSSTTATEEEEMDAAFDSTFSLTWSTNVSVPTSVSASASASAEQQAAAAVVGDGIIKTVDLVPGGRHRSVKFAERKEFVSKLVWRLLIGSVRKQVAAFREGWHFVLPRHWPAQGVNTGTGRGGELQEVGGSGRRGAGGGGGGGGAKSATEILAQGGLAVSLFHPEELSQAILSNASSSSSSSIPASRLDIDDIRSATELVLPPPPPSSSSSSFASTTIPTAAAAATGAAGGVTSTTSDVGMVVDWFWDVWSRKLSPLHQRRLLAFITGAEDVPASGARGIGLRIHLVATATDGSSMMDPRSWPLPWSSTCTSTLFLPTYPDPDLLEEKVRIAIEHYQGFGLR